MTAAVADPATAAKLKWRFSKDGKRPKKMVKPEADGVTFSAKPAFGPQAQPVPRTAKPAPKNGKFTQPAGQTVGVPAKFTNPKADSKLLSTPGLRCKKGVPGCNHAPAVPGKNKEPAHAGPATIRDIQNLVNSPTQHALLTAELQRQDADAARAVKAKQRAVEHQLARKKEADLKRVIKLERQEQQDKYHMRAKERADKKKRRDAVRAERKRKNMRRQARRERRHKEREKRRKRTRRKRRARR